jgi:hypothetical protein
MGYGGIFKSVARIATSYVGFQLGGPFGAAVASSAFTAASGGSFKEALISGATSYVGAQISQGLNARIADAAAGAGVPAGSISPIGYQPPVDSLGYQAALGYQGDIFPIPANTLGYQGDISGVDDFITEGARTALQAPTELAAESSGGFLNEAARSLVDTPIDLSAVTAPISGITDALKGFTDPFLSATSHVGGVYAAVNKDLLGNLLPKFTEGFEITNAGGLLASGVGGIATLTLEQALNMELPGLDEALIDEAGFNQQAIQFIRQEARNALSQGAFDEILAGGLENPFLRETTGTPEEIETARQAQEDEFRKVIAAGIERRNVDLGPDITEAQFRTVFDDPNLGQAILSDEEALRRQSFGQQIGEAFPGDAFQSLDDNIISSIVEERQGPAQQQISRFGARGNLNPTGGQTANLFIEEQVPRARERVEDIGAGVLGGYERDIGEIRGRAEQQAGEYRLGEDLFDVAPFSEERGKLIEARQGTLGSDVRSAIGSEPLFDVSGALRAGGRAQGIVSGRGQNQALLDQIAARELGSTSTRNRRGLGSRGSGAF